MMLTTIDNPYSPYSQYPEWLQWDHDHGYFTQEYISRIADIGDEDDEDILAERFESAIFEILEHDMLGIYILAEET